MSKKSTLDSPKHQKGVPRNSEVLSLKQTPQKLYGRRVTEFQRTPDCFSKVAIDSPLTKSKNIAFSADVLNLHGKTDLSCFDIENENIDSSTIRVGVRVRPFTQRYTKYFI